MICEQYINRYKILEGTKPNLATKKPLSRYAKAQIKLAVYINRIFLTKLSVFNIGAAPLFKCIAILNDLNLAVKRLPPLNCL